LKLSNNAITKDSGSHRSLQRCICYLIALILIAASQRTFAQVTFSSALDIATRKNPRILMAQDDVHKAEAVVKESKDVYIPSVVANGGAGDSYGITLSVPTIFTANAQSLVYSASQRDYIRASKIQLEAATRRVASTRAQLEEDAIVAYLELDHAQRKAANLAEQSIVANRLLGTMQNRASAGIASAFDLRRSRHDAVEIQLETLQAQDELAFLREHLAGILGIAAADLTIDPSSIPAPDVFAVGDALLGVASPDTPALLDAQANAASNEKRAAGDRRLHWQPQISFAAQYGRISPINGVTDFYNIHGEYNTFFGGLTFQFPILDKVQRDHSRESQADADHAVHALADLRASESENSLRARHAIAELSIKAELAQMDLANAEDELKSIHTQVQSGTAGRPISTPMDEDRAILHQYQLSLAELDADLNLLIADVSFLRQTNQLDTRLRHLLPPH
jgi:outer membrane protein TolC